MDYLTAMECSPVYEFPYCGYQTCSVPVCTNDINTLLSNITPSIDDLCCYQSPAVTLNCVPQINSSICNRNTLAYQVPENMPIEDILQQFGINANTLQRSGVNANTLQRSGVNMNILQPCGSLNSCCRNVCGPMDVTIFSPLRRRRRRLVCHEVSDSEDDTYYRRPQRPRRYSDDPDFGPDHRRQPPAAVRNLLSDVWDRARTASENLPRSSSDSNLARQWEAMRRSVPPPPPSSNLNMDNIWRSMQSTPPTPPPSNRNMDNIWRAMQSTPPPSNSNIDNIWRAMQSTPPPSNSNMNNIWRSMQSTPPPSNPNMNNIWQAMQSTSPPSSNVNMRNVWQAMQSPPPQANPAIANAWQAMQRSPPPQANPMTSNAWQAMLNASPSMSPAAQSAVSHVWHDANLASQQRPDRLSQAFDTMRQPTGTVIQPPPSQVNPAVLNAWNRANLVSPQMGNYSWNRPQNTPYSYPPRGLIQGTPSPIRGPAPASFAALLAQAHRQRLPYAGAA